MSAIFLFSQPKQLNLLPRSSRLTVPLPARTLHFWRHFLVKHKILPNLVVNNWLWWIMRVLLLSHIRIGEIFWINNNFSYYAFKIFPQFWLVKSTHHNQLRMTKFGRILCLTKKWRQKSSPLLVNAPLTEKTRRWWVVFVVKTKMGTLHSFQE